MEMALLFILFWGFWAPVMTTLTPETLLTPASEKLLTTEVLLSSAVSIGPIARDPKETGSTSNLTSSPSSPTPFGINDLPLLGTSTGEPESTTSQDDATKKSSVLPETSNATGDSAVGDSIVRGGIMTFSSLKPSNGTNGPPVTAATSFLESISETSGPPVAMATSSMKPSEETSGPSVTMATSSLEPSNKTSGASITMATSSLEPSNETSGPSITMATSSLKPFNETSGHPVAITTSSLEASSVASDSPVSSIKISIKTTLKPLMNTSPGPSPAPVQGSNGMLLVPVLVALLVVAVLVALLLLWRQRQKRRTGVLTLSSGTKRNGVLDAWAGPAQVPDEEAMAAIAGGSGGDKGSGVPEVERSGQRPALTTFFSKRKSRQGSLVMEELKSESSPNLKGEEEPLVGSEDEVVEGPTSNGPEVGDGAVPQTL
ncbi:leukosialin [Castor canadensis]|uniref:Leukosialin n=1 Tax=Castor canadensis TaxID=51338 RepID=A0A8B7U2N8_CASCN